MRYLLIINKLQTLLENKKLFEMKESRPDRRDSFISKKFQLYSWGIFSLRLPSVKKFYLTKLFIRDTEYAYLTKLGQKRLYSLYMNRRVLTAGAMPYIDGELKHGKAIALQVLAKINICLLFIFGFGRQIKKHKHPHNPIFT